MIITDNNKIKTSEMMDKFKKKFDTYCYWSSGDLDKYFPQPKESTTREFKDEQEPEMLGRTYNEIYKEVGDRMMTFREYLLAFEYYFDKYDRYLDIDYITLFGDRLPGGEKVARGYWRSSRAQAGFFWYYRGSSSPSVGGRVAIPLNPSSLKTKGTVITQLDRIEAKLDKLLNNFGIK